MEDIFRHTVRASCNFLLMYTLLKHVCIKQQIKAPRNFSIYSNLGPQVSIRLLCGFIYLHTVEMDGTCGTYGGHERFTNGFGEEI